MTTNTTGTTETKKGKTTYFYRLFRVRRSDGRVTTVSMRPELVARACKLMGDVKPVGRFVREAALAYEDSRKADFGSCSGYVSKQLAQMVKELEAKAAQERSTLSEVSA